MRLVLRCFLVVVLFGVVVETFAQKPSPQLPPDVRASYFAFKRGWEAMYASGAANIRLGSSTDLRECLTSDVFIGEVNYPEHIRDLVEIAYDIVTLKKKLTASGYPRTIWRPWLIEHEAESLRIHAADLASGVFDESEEEGDSETADVGEIPLDAATPDVAMDEEVDYDGPYTDLLEKLNTYREKSGEILPIMVAEGNCGAGGDFYEVHITPPNGRVQMMPEFFHDVCRARGVDPFDSTRCTFWLDPAPSEKEGVGRLEGIIGDYVYQASWPDGGSHRGRLRMDGLSSPLVFRPRR